MKNLIMAFILAFFSFPVWAVMSLGNGLELTCISTDGINWDSCNLRGALSSTDSAMLGGICDKPYVLKAAEVTDLKAILVNAKTNVKTQCGM